MGCFVRISIASAIVVLLTTIVCGDKAAPSGLSLPDLEGKSVRPLAETGVKAVIFIFARSDCPISNRYAPEIRRLSLSFKPENVRFWLVYPGANEPVKSIRQHIREYDYGCEALRDPRHELVKLTGASVTPEAAVFISQRTGVKMIYRGRIDDQYAAAGKHRPGPTVHDLEDALNAIVKGSTLKFKTTVATGCYISDLE